MEVKGKQLLPKFTVGALEKYYELTGEDLLFGGAKMDTPLKRKAFIFIGVEHQGFSIDDFNDLELKEFSEVLEFCLGKFTESFGGSGEEKDAEGVKKN